MILNQTALVEPGTEHRILFQNTQFKKKPTLMDHLYLHILPVKAIL